MCGRATLVTDVSEIAEMFGVDPIALGPVRFNVAPGQPVLVVRSIRSKTREENPDAKPHELALLKWGLVPKWAPDPKIGGRFVQARAETVETTNAFRNAFKWKRCLFVADGFFEWKTEGTGKMKQRIPHHVTRADGKPLAIAAVWERWKSKAGEELESCAVVTTSARGSLASLHDRMPLLLDEADRAAWLEGQPAAHEVVQRASEIAEARAKELVVVPVSTWVNDVKHDDPQCIEPMTDEPREAQAQLGLRFTSTES